MCIGDVGLDTIGSGERAALRSLAGEDFPRHAFDTRANADGLTWVVLEPPASRTDLLRITICRIAPCLMVMVEDMASSERRIGSASDVEGAMAFARTLAGQTALARAHPIHAVLQ